MNNYTISYFVGFNESLKNNKLGKQIKEYVNERSSFENKLKKIIEAESKGEKMKGDKELFSHWIAQKELKYWEQEFIENYKKANDSWALEMRLDMIEDPDLKLSMDCHFSDDYGDAICTFTLNIKTLYNFDSSSYDNSGSISKVLPSLKEVLLPTFKRKTNAGAFNMIDFMNFENRRYIQYMEGYEEERGFKFLDASDKRTKADAFAAIRSQDTLGAYAALPEEFKNDREIILAGLATSPRLFAKLPDEFKNDKDIVMDVLEKDPLLIEYAGKVYREDFKLIRKLIKKNKNVINCIPKELEFEASKLIFSYVQAKFVDYDINEGFRYGFEDEKGVKYDFCDMPNDTYKFDSGSDTSRWPGDKPNTAYVGKSFDIFYKKVNSSKYVERIFLVEE